MHAVAKPFEEEKFHRAYVQNVSITIFALCNNCNSSTVTYLSLIVKRIYCIQITDLEYPTDFCIVLKYTLHTHSNKVFIVVGYVHT